jgi:hypothetical protein
MHHTAEFSVGLCRALSARKEIANCAVGDELAVLFARFYMAAAATHLWAFVWAGDCTRDLRHGMALMLIDLSRNKSISESLSINIIAFLKTSAARKCPFSRRTEKRSTDYACITSASTAVRLRRRLSIFVQDI